MKSPLERRYALTLRFMQDFAPPPATVLDLGTPNSFSAIMEKKGYQVFNTQGEDLDFEYDVVKNYDVDLVTAFEIFEHMVAPFNVLRVLPAKKLVATVPLRLWFSKAYWNEKDPWDRHYHEFEPRQFDMLLEKAGWKIVKAEKWTSASYKVGIRPLLRHFVPRYYAVACERIFQKRSVI